MNRKRWMLGAVALAVAAAVALALIFLPSRKPGLPPGQADGAYVNYCCGTIELRDGEMVLGGGQTVGFELRVDEAGPYLLPDAYVGTWEDRGFEVDGTRTAVKLRLDRIPEPNRIAIPAARGWYSFERKVPVRLPEPR